MNVALAIRQATVIVIIFNVLDVSVSVLVVIMRYGSRFFSSFSILALIEAGLLMMIAGGMDLSSSIFVGKARQLVLGSQKDWSMGEQKSTHEHALRYLIAGLLLLAEAILLSMFL